MDRLVSRASTRRASTRRASTSRASRRASSRRAGVAALPLGALLVTAAACILPPETRPTAVAVRDTGPATAPDLGPFELKAEPNVACERADPVDVNLGHTPEAFVRAAYCQVNGAEPTAAAIEQWSAKLRAAEPTRRIDVVNTFCKAAGRDCKRAYSDPWKSQVELTGAPNKTVKRDIGAVFLFFFDCPGRVNCGMDWANTHSPGMDSKSPLLAFGDAPDGYYDPDEAGFWKRELMDARWAGVDFILPNVYGPDIEDNKLQPFLDALEDVEDPPKIGMFDDTWTWGEPWFSDFWKQRPNMQDTEAAAKTLYDAKWKPYFQTVPEKHWYRVDGKPFIYFYNAGKLEPRGASSAVLARMKQMFAADFGSEPYLVVDEAFFEDRQMDTVADSRFRWFTFDTPEGRSRATDNGKILDHGMVRWDAVGREHPGEPAKSSDLVVKGGAVLKQLLDLSKDADMLILATWNDLGEGTGVNRNYDYYLRGYWHPPHYFMRMIRESQEGK